MKRTRLTLLMMTGAVALTLVPAATSSARQRVSPSSCPVAAAVLEPEVAPAPVVAPAPPSPPAEDLVPAPIEVASVPPSGADPDQTVSTQTQTATVTPVEATSVELETIEADTTVSATVPASAVVAAEPAPTTEVVSAPVEAHVVPTGDVGSADLAPSAFSSQFGRSRERKIEAEPAPPPREVYTIEYTISIDDVDEQGDLVLHAAPNGRRCELIKPSFLRPTPGYEIDPKADPTVEQWCCIVIPLLKDRTCTATVFIGNKPTEAGVPYTPRNGFGLQVSFKMLKKPPTGTVVKIRLACTPP